MWNSKHIFIHDYILLEKFLKNNLLPFLDKGSVDNYFYIRYWDGGPHIRLRYKLNTIEEEKKMEESLMKLLSEFKEDNCDYKFKLVTYNNAIVETENIKPSDIYPNLSIEDIVYYPEFSRYGGVDVMEKSENLFVSSSKFSSLIIQKFERNQIYSIAIDLMYGCARIANECGYFDDYKTFFYAYRGIWEKFSGSITPPELKSAIKRRVSRLKEKNVTSEFYKSYFNDFKESLEYIKKNQKEIQPEYIMYIAISHIHMFNNRLGISPEHEYMFSNSLLEIV